MTAHGVAASQANPMSLLSADGVDIMSMGSTAAGDGGGETSGLGARNVGEPAGSKPGGALPPPIASMPTTLKEHPASTRTRGHHCIPEQRSKRGAAARPPSATNSAFISKLVGGGIRLAASEALRSVGRGSDALKWREAIHRRRRSILIASR